MNDHRMGQKPPYGAQPQVERQPRGDRAGIHCFDPRDPDQKASDPSTWKPTLNPALIFGNQYKGFHLGDEFWRGIAHLATSCDRD